MISPRHLLVPAAILALSAGAVHAQQTTLSFDGKAALSGTAVPAPGSDRIADAILVLSGQDIFRMDETVVTVTAGKLLSVSEAEIRFEPSAGTDIGEVAIETGPDTVFCAADGTVSTDWLAPGAEAVAIAPQDGGPARSVRNALWFYTRPNMIPTPLDPACTNAGYPVITAE